MSYKDDVSPPTVGRSRSQWPRLGTMVLERTRMKPDENTDTHRIQKTMGVWILPLNSS